MILKPVGPGIAGYYLHQGRGEWTGRGCAILGLAGDVGSAELTRVLRGCDPASGAYLPAVKPARRRAGWDLVFAAPKSLSLLGAVEPGGGGLVVAAHRAAVSDVFERFEDERLGRDGGVAAAFQHTTNAAGEPHVHTHLLLANLRRSDGEGRWFAARVAVRRDELAALYQLGLRHHLAAAGWNLDWRLRPDGLADLASVPRAAVRAASTRSHESRLEQPFTGRSRTGREKEWPVRVMHAGFGPDQAARAGGGRADVKQTGEDLADLVSSRLAAKGSTFSRREVVVALAASSTAGAPASEALAWAQRFCDSSLPVGPGRWTSRLARAADDRLRTQIRERHAVVSPAPLGFSGVDPPAAGALLASSALTVLTAPPGRSNFVADAAVLSACAAVWESQGLRASVAGPPGGAARWSALTGVQAFVASSRPDVLIVDQADRRPPGELMALLSAAPAARLVLVEGGTAMRGRLDASLAFSEIARGSNRVDPGPQPVWTPGRVAGGLATTAGAAAELLTRWLDAGGARGHALMVGLGVPEVLALNDSARCHMRALGDLSGPVFEAAGRQFQAGDRVVALRSIAAGVGAGTVGTVLELEPRAPTVKIGWPSKRMEADRHTLRRVGHAYATTPKMASLLDSPVFILGRVEGLKLDRARVAAEVAVTRDGAIESGRSLGLER